MLLTNHDQRAKRLSICKECEHFVPATQSCGTLGIGKTINRGRGKVKLCGCVMPVKAKFKMAGCPLKKWHPIYTEKELDEWEMRLNSLNGRANADQQRWIEETILKISGVARKINNCPPCLKSMVDDIGRFIKESRRNVASCEKKSEESLEK